MTLPVLLGALCLKPDKAQPGAKPASLEAPPGMLWMPCGPPHHPAPPPAAASGRNTQDGLIGLGRRGSRGRSRKISQSAKYNIDARLAGHQLLNHIAILFMPARCGNIRTPVNTRSLRSAQGPSMYIFHGADVKLACTTMLPMPKGTHQAQRLLRGFPSPLSQRPIPYTQKGRT